MERFTVCPFCGAKDLKDHPYFKYFKLNVLVCYNCRLDYGLIIMNNRNVYGIKPLRFTSIMFCLEENFKEI